MTSVSFAELFLHHLKFNFMIAGVSIKFEVGSQFEKSRRQY